MKGQQKENIFRKKEIRNNRKLCRMLDVAIAIIIICLQWYQLEYSAVDATQIWKRDLSVIFMNLGIVFCINAFVLWVTNRLWISFLITNITVGLVSIVNYYVILFHGAPLVYSELVNALTAKNVLSGFTLPITRKLMVIVGILLLLMVFVLILYFVRNRPTKKVTGRGKKLIIKGVELVAIVLIFGWIYKSVNVTILWSWKPAIEEYGYLAYAVSDFKDMKTAYNIPEGYEADKISGIAGSEQEAEELPDVILILNETFYDLEVFTDVNADKEYLGQFYQIENAVRGYALTPSSMSTNKSEYELLTSNSMYLLNSAAPFNNLDLSGATSVVQYFKDLGYETWALHAADSANYSRNRAYPALGFDHIRFIDEMHVDKYGNRYITDEKNYLDLIESYESSEVPKFMYLLTFQNHGGYEQNDSEFDLVHTQRDFGKYTDEVDEFLTSISMTDEALINLLDYFETVDRPVIVAMVGDHAPSFIYNIEARTGMSETEKLIAQNTVPFIIWANYELDIQEEIKHISLTDMVPIMLQTAGFPMSAYYQYICDLNAVIPIRTSYGSYIDAENTIGIYNKDSIYYDMLSMYYYMEYNNLHNGDDYLPELFGVK